jgi:trehalose/maltose transport system permease protein
MRTAGRTALLWLASAPIVLFSVGPLYYAFVTSVGRGSQALQPHLLPASWSLESYIAVFREQPFGWSIVNSLLIAGAAVGVALLLGLIAAYALGRLQFRGRGMLLASFLCVSMFPQIAMLSGLFELIRALGLYNTRIGLTLSYLILTCPFTVWLLTTYMREIPREIEEAAIIDGASPWVIAARVFAPVMAPALVSTGLLAFVAAWNEFLFALTFTLTPEKRTVPVSIALMSGASAYELPWGQIMAASVLVSVPIVILALVFQRRIVSGLTAGAVK